MQIIIYIAKIEFVNQKNILNHLHTKVNAFLNFNQKRRLIIKMIDFRRI